MARCVAEAIVRPAAKAARSAHEFISAELPDGYDITGGGVSAVRSVSAAGCQRQLDTAHVRARAARRPAHPGFSGSGSRRNIAGHACRVRRWRPG